MQLELLICLHNSQRGGDKQDYTQFAVLILCHDSTGCNEMGDYFAIEAVAMIDERHCEGDLNKDCF